MNIMDLQLKFNDASEQAKAIMDLIEAAENEPVADGTLWRAAQAARERIEKAEKQFHKLHRAYRKATKEGEPPADTSADDPQRPPDQLAAAGSEWFADTQAEVRRCLESAFSAGFEAGRKSTE